MIVCCLILVLVILYIFSSTDLLSSVSIGGGGRVKNKHFYMIDLNAEKSVKLLSYLAIEYAIENTNDRVYNRGDLEAKSHFFLKVLGSKMPKSRKLFIDATDRVNILLESIPKHETIGKPIVIQKLFNYEGQAIMYGEIKGMTSNKKIIADSNILRNEKMLDKLKTIGSFKSLVMPTQIVCDSSYHKEIRNIKKIDTSASYKLYLNKDYLLTYTCKGSSSNYSLINVRNVGTSSTKDTEYERREIKRIHDSKEKNWRLIELYFSKAVKDLGIMICGVVEKMPVISQDAWFALVANRIFNIAMIYSKPVDRDNLQYYSRRTVDGFSIV